MNLKFVVLAFSVTLFVEFSNAAPLPENNEVSPQKVTDRQILEFIIDGVNNVVNVGISDRKWVMEQVLKDKLLLNHKTMIMEQYLERIRNFINLLNHLNGTLIPEELIAVAEEFPKLFEQFEKPETPEAELIKAVIDKKGKDAWEEVVEQVLTDETFLNYKTENMARYLEEFRKVNKIVGSFISNVMFDALVLIEGFRLFEQFEEPKTPEAELIKASLIKNGVRVGDIVFSSTVRDFADGFVKMAQNYYNGLSKEKKEKEKKIQVWIEQVKEARGQLLFDYINHLKFISLEKEHNKA